MDWKGGKWCPVFIVQLSLLPLVTAPSMGGKRALMGRITVDWKREPLRLRTTKRGDSFMYLSV